MAQTYEISNGVRRAKALLVAGHKTAEVEFYVAGVRQLLTVPLADLRSPYREIEASRNAMARNRWHGLLQIARSSTASYPFNWPIEVVPNGQGFRLKDVDVV